MFHTFCGISTNLVRFSQKAVYHRESFVAKIAKAQGARRSERRFQHADAAAGQRGLRGALAGGGGGGRRHLREVRPDRAGARRQGSQGARQQLECEVRFRGPSILADIVLN